MYDIFGNCQTKCTEIYENDIKGRIVINLCLGIEIAEAEDEKFLISDSM